VPVPAPVSLDCLCGTLVTMIATSLVGITVYLIFQVVLKHLLDSPCIVHGTPLTIHAHVHVARHSAQRTLASAKTYENACTAAATAAGRSWLPNRFHLFLLAACASTLRAASRLCRPPSLAADLPASSLVAGRCRALAATSPPPPSPTPLPPNRWLAHCWRGRRW
jgi:hypothetical protein